MVTFPLQSKSMLLLGEQPAKSVLEQLEPPQRAAVFMALLGLVLTGLALVTCVMIGARWVRGIARHKPGSRESIALGAARRQHGRQSLTSILPDSKAGDTLQLGNGPDDTRPD